MSASGYDGAGENPRQIVRSFDDGDYLPDYTTAQLLLGVCHVVRGLRHRKNKPTVEVVIKTPTQIRAEQAKEEASKHFEAVKVRLQAFKTNWDIAEELSLSISSVRRIIRQSHELAKISQARRVQLRQAGDGRFGPCRSRAC